jgi:hypothetical protein
MTDWSDDPDAQEFLLHAERQMAPMMRDSAAAVHLMPTSGEGDPKFWVELGCAIMLDKPLIVIVPQGSYVPRRLWAVADEVIDVPVTGPDQETADKIVAALKKLAP